LNPANAYAGHNHRQMHGPLMMGHEEGSPDLRPIYHLMDNRVWDPAEKGLQIVFK